MGKFDGMCLLSDMDGTIYDSQTKLPERNLNGIKYFIENGGRFALASGRSPISIKSHKDELLVNAPCVILNGCGVYDYDQQRYVYTNFLDPAAKKAVVQLAEEFPMINTVIFRGDGSMIVNKSLETLPPCFDAKVVPGIIDEDLGKYLNEDWFKIVFVGLLDDLKNIEKRCADIDIGAAETVFAGDDMFEFLPEHCSKGEGFRQMVKYLGFPIKKAFAIGDYYNDQEMLDYAGMSAACGQAPEDLKEHANFVACHCDEGALGWFIEKLDSIY